MFLYSHRCEMVTVTKTNYLCCGYFWLKTYTLVLYLAIKRVRSISPTREWTSLDLVGQWSTCSPSTSHLCWGNPPFGQTKHCKTHETTSKVGAFFHQAAHNVEFFAQPLLESGEAQIFRARTITRCLRWSFEWETMLFDPSVHRSIYVSNKTLSACAEIIITVFKCTYM